MKIYKYYCNFCNKYFESKQNNRKFCSKSCGAKYRAQRNHNKYYEDRICLICGKKFNRRKKIKNKTCSKKCGLKLSGIKKRKRINKVCEICGENFETIPSSDQTTCSIGCGQKKNWKLAKKDGLRKKNASKNMKKIGESNKGKDPWNKGLKGKQKAWNKRERINFKCKICHRDYESYLKNGKPRKITCGSIYCKQAKIPLPKKHKIDVDNWIEPVKKMRCKICAKEFEVLLGRSGLIKGWKHKRGKGKKKLYTCSKECFEILRAKLLVNNNGCKCCDTKPELEAEKLLKENNIRYKKQYWQRDGKRIVFYDFILWDYNLLLEIDGDYWHANPKFFSTMNEAQRKNVNNDKYKEKLAKNRDFLLFRIWESEIEERFEILIKLLKSL